MDSGSWRRLFESIRPDDQENLVVVTVTGFEIAVYRFARLEDELVMIRGRVAGTAEGSRVFLIPYSQLATVYVNREVLSEEVELFSPAVSLERKAQVARHVADLAERAREQAKAAEPGKRQQEGIPVDLQRQLEELRSAAGFGTPSPAGAPAASPAAAPPAAPAAPAAIPLGPAPTGPTQLPAKVGVATPSTTDDKKPGLPPRFTIPKLPERKPGS